MTKYAKDGSVIPSNIPVGKRTTGSHYQLFGLFRGVVMETVYSDSPQNRSQSRIEYVVKVNGQSYPNAVNIRDGGGIHNFSERIRQHSTKDLDLVNLIRKDPHLRI